jgi:hypothetical protein
LDEIILKEILNTVLDEQYKHVLKIQNNPEINEKILAENVINICKLRIFL